MTTPSLAHILATTPILQAPMAGATNVDTVIAAQQAGALGALGAGMMSPAQIHQAISDIKARTDAPFCVNLMVLSDDATSQYSQAMPTWLSELYQSLDVVPSLDDKPAHSFGEQFQVLLDNPVSIASFTFGIISTGQMAALKAVGTLVIGTANHPDEVLAWSALGADAVIIQGAEAGGHRGGWLCESDMPLVLAELFSQTKQCLTQENIETPIIVAGGIADRAQVVRYLSAGAAAVVVGTAFLSTVESCISPIWKQRLLAGGETQLTRLYSGKLARGLVTEYMQQFAHLDGLERHDQLPVYPTLNAMTKSLRVHGTKTANSELMSLWAGANVGACRDETMAALVGRLVM
ncbi:nitronate monooxygenase [Moraxella sp. FZLJ2107]|uniref:NAD(P)H-dependent flavin oxidoreductase n=1 Tax=unclassified Moraxella TaxID=2685852 RepID=UPI0020C92598|nr:MULTISPECIES: nitronate monooxygenase [unclassified Moraxella]UTO05035.1 nitronate monooxygenase [Moraxella sp. FZLJ2107]UTO21770.1 nitronate monooxygenase [Moraxella sp. FZLJ2109]